MATVRMATVRMGIVGSGMIANVIARAAADVEGIIIAGVASRRLESVRSFAEQHAIAKVYDNWQALVRSGNIDAVYVATPTSVKEEISLLAAENTKSILVDKPFRDAASLRKIIEAASAHGVAFMDATHFPHHGRTKEIQATMKESIGEPLSLHSSFYFPALDRANIRYDKEKEPTGCVGDMAWYSMRAIVEYLKPEGEVVNICGCLDRDKLDGAVVGGSGMLVFDDAKRSTFSFGYNCSTCLMDLDIIGEKGVLQLDDFVLDYKNGFAFDNPEHRVGYFKRSGVERAEDAEFIVSQVEDTQVNEMLKLFIHFCRKPGEADEKNVSDKSMWTQELLDQFWREVSGVTL